MQFTLKSIIFLVSFTLLSSCSKEEDYSNMPVYLPGNITKGHISMKKNNREMKASASSVVCYRDSAQLALFFGTFDSEEVLSEYFVVQCLELNLNNQKLCKNQDMNCLLWMYYETLIEDQAEDIYILNTSKNNFIQLTEIDTATGWISGKLEMHFDRDKSKPKRNVNNPEKVSFTEGNFSIKLPD